MRVDVGAMTHHSHQDTRCVGRYRFKMSKGKKVEEVAPEINLEPEIVSGSGVFLYPNGAQYEGEWKSLNGIKYRDGQGIFTFGPEKYSGEWKNDLMNGEGVYHFSSGACYTGLFVNNAFEGY
jgi:hypothetical protein